MSLTLSAMGNLDQCHLFLDEVGVFVNLQDRDELMQLFNNLFDHPNRSGGDDSETRIPALRDGSDSQRLDVVPPRREEVGNPGERARFVIDDDRDYASRFCHICHIDHDLSLYSSIMLKSDPPAGTMGRTFSRRSTTTSIMATTFFSTASLSAASNSSLVVTR